MAYFGDKKIIDSKFQVYKDGINVGYYELQSETRTEYPDMHYCYKVWKLKFVNDHRMYDEDAGVKLKSFRCEYKITIVDCGGNKHTLSSSGTSVQAPYCDDTDWLRTSDVDGVEIDIDGSYWGEITYEIKDSLGNEFSGSGIIDDGSEYRNYGLCFLEAPSFNETQNEVTVFYKRRDIPKDEKEYVKVLSAEIGIALQDSDTMLVPFRAVNKDIKEDSYTFIFTEEEKQALIDGVTKGTSANIRYVLKTESNLGNNYGYDFSNKTFSLVGAEPILDPIVEDGNTVTAALTGNINTMVKYHSTAVYAINAAASKGATIVYQEASCGNKKNTSPYGQLDNVESGNFLFTVVDSRETIAYKTIEKKFINYIKPTCNVTKVDADATKIIFNVSGNFFNDTFGAVHNEVSITYRCKIGDAEYGAPAQVPVADISTNGNTYSADVTLTDIEYKNRYVIEATVTDKLSSATNTTTVKIIPIFDWGEDDFNFNVPVTYTTLEGN